MSGLETILKHIEDNANNNAMEHIENAKKEADAIIKKAEEDASLRFNQIIEQSNIDVDSYISNQEASANLEKRRIILDTKQEIIKVLISQAKNYLVNLSTEDYFDVLIKMIKKYSLGREGQIIFSQKDKERMPKLFQVKIYKAISSIEGASLEISKETRDIEGGFILNYGEIEQNCSFDALFSDKKELLQDQVYKLLFDESTV